MPQYEDLKPGIWASACAFAFMGGVERIVGEKDLLGVHQFYSTSDIDSELAQRLAGLTLLHTIQMGVDPSVIVLASATSPDEMHWFSKAELVNLNIDNTRSFTEDWGLEPYKNGLVLHTEHHESTRRSVDVTLFCRASTNSWHMLLSESNGCAEHGHKDGKFLNFRGQYRSNYPPPPCAEGSGMIHGWDES